MSLVIKSRAYIPTPLGDREIQLCVGDITKQPSSEKVDIVLVSAFANDYAAMRTSVIGALKYNLGINVEVLSRNKKEDLRSQFSCWISEPLKPEMPYRQLVCFERIGSIKEVKPLDKSIEDMFRALFPAFNNEDKSVITPLLATGFQMQDETEMLSTMVRCAVGWMHLGLPLQLFKIVVYSKNPSKPNRMVEMCTEMFSRLKQRIEKPQNVKEPAITHDTFVIYHPTNEEIKTQIESRLKLCKKRAAIITMSCEETTTDKWKYETKNQMITCARVVPLLSHSFMNDTRCIDLYNIALCCNRLTRRNIMAPICLERLSLPVYMGMVQWIDCRQQTKEQIMEGCERLIGQVQADNKKPSHYDVFISYSHQNMEKAEVVRQTLTKTNPNLRIFFDNVELKTGVNWQQTLYESIDKSRCVIALISPNYIKSTVCGEEFSLSLTRHFLKDKGLELIPLVIEDVAFPPTALYYLEPIQASNSAFETVTKDVCSKLCGWLSDGGTCDILSKVEFPIDLDDLTSQRREKSFNQFYTFSENRLHLKHLLNNPQENSLSEECDIFISHSASDTKFASFIFHALEKIQPKAKVFMTDPKSKDKDLTKINSARVLVVLLSHRYISSVKEMEEFNMILSKERSGKHGRMMYVIKLDDLLPKPTYIHLVPCDTSLKDAIWKLFVENHQTISEEKAERRVEIAEDFHYARWMVEDSHEKLSDEETMALMKAFVDIECLLTKQSYLPESDQIDTVLHNIINLHETVNGRSESVKEKIEKHEVTSEAVNPQAEQERDDMAECKDNTSSPPEKDASSSLPEDIQSSTKDEVKNISQTHEDKISSPTNQGSSINQYEENTAQLRRRARSSACHLL